MKMAENYRPDNIQRWEIIRDYIAPLSGKTLVDVGCHNGWFCQQFLCDGGSRAVGIEIDEALINKCVELGLENFSVKRSKEEVDDVFDCVLFLNLQYHNNIDYLEWCKNHGKVCFISAAGNRGEANANNERIKGDLMKWFKNVTPVIPDYAGRIIYKCS